MLHSCMIHKQPQTGINYREENGQIIINSCNKMLYIRGWQNHGWYTKCGLSPAFVGPEGHEWFLCFFPVGKKKKKENQNENGIS